MRLEPGEVKAIKAAAAYAFGPDAANKVGEHLTATVLIEAKRDRGIDDDHRSGRTHAQRNG